MPEWIEFCREYDKHRIQNVSVSVSRWWAQVSEWYKTTDCCRAYFDLDDDGTLLFTIEGVITYRWNLGEDHAV